MASTKDILELLATDEDLTQKVEELVEAVRDELSREDGETSGPRFVGEPGSRTRRRYNLKKTRKHKKRK